MVLIDIIIAKVVVTMTDGERSINRNKIIITIAILVLVFFFFVIVLLNSEFNETMNFRFIKDQNTGEPIGLIISLFLYVLLWWFLGLVPSACVFLYMMCVYGILHIKDKRLFEHGYFPPYEEEFDYGGHCAFISTYVAIFILLFLHITSIITINIF